MYRGITIAIGFYLDGTVTDFIGLIHTAWVGALMVAGAVVLTGLSMTLEKKDQKQVRL